MSDLEAQLAESKRWRTMWWHSQCFSAMCGAASRTDELVVQKHLHLTRAAVRELRLYTVDHCEKTVSLWKQGAPRGDDENIQVLPAVTAEIVAAIEAALPAMRTEMAAIESDLDIKAALNKWRVYRYDIGMPGDPGDDADTWEALGTMAATVCKDEAELRKVKKMLKQYVVLRATAPTEAWHPDASHVML